MTWIESVKAELNVDCLSYRLAEAVITSPGFGVWTMAGLSSDGTGAGTNVNKLADLIDNAAEPTGLLRGVKVARTRVDVWYLHIATFSWSIYVPSEAAPEPIRRRVYPWVVPQVAALIFDQTVYMSVVAFITSETKKDDKLGPVRKNEAATVALSLSKSFAASIGAN